MIRLFIHSFHSFVWFYFTAHVGNNRKLWCNAVIKPRSLYTSFCPSISRSHKNIPVQHMYSDVYWCRVFLWHFTLICPNLYSSPAISNGILICDDCFRPTYNKNVITCQHRLIKIMYRNTELEYKPYILLQFGWRSSNTGATLGED